MPRKHRFPLCPSTGKIRYHERNDATYAVRSARRMRSRAAVHGGSCTNRVERSYRCPDCLGWHLTSQPRRPKPTAPTADVARRIYAAMNAAVR